jgi:hypothetical protein
MGRNIRVALPPFALPTISTVTSEDPDFPVENVLNDVEPDFPFRTGSIGADQSTVFGFGGAFPLTGLYVNRTNYSAIRLHKSDDGSAWDNCAPNILTWSRRPRRASGAGDPETPWGKTGTLDVTDAAAAGVFAGSGATLLEFQSGATLTYTDTIGAGSLISRVLCATIWLRAVDGGTEFTASFTPSGGGSLTYGAALSVGQSWRRFVIPFVLGSGDSGSGYTLALTAAADSHVLFGGASLSLDTDQPPFADYETTDAGLIIPRYRGTGRRQVLLDMAGFQSPFLRYRIPGGQDTDDGVSYYSTGGMTFTDRLKQWAGSHVSVPVPSFGQATLVREFPSASQEFNQNGARYAVLELGGAFLAEEAEDDVLDLWGVGVGKPVLIFPNIRKGGFPLDNANPEQAWLMRRTSDAKLGYGEMPEVFEAGFAFREVI